MSEVEESGSARVGIKGLNSPRLDALMDARMQTCKQA
jgi:hypothetical protein